MLNVRIVANPLFTTTRWLNSVFNSSCIASQLSEKTGEMKIKQIICLKICHNSLQNLFLNPQMRL